ncbi:MAG: LysM peptidoglycan-binding domain-containing protein [Anaerolineales bacterium]|jgi:LysM repeat protein
MSSMRRSTLVLTLIIILVLGVTGCTRSASTPPPSSDEGTGEPQSETEATMDAVRSAILTQTAQALEAGGGATATPTPEPTENPTTAAAETAAPTATAIPDQIEYTVQPGDWIFKIARQFGVDPQEIIDLNELTNPASLEVGTVLKIPGAAVEPTSEPAPLVTTTGTPGTAVPSGTVHIVQPGEWIWQIARLYGVDPQAIIDLNQLTSPATIYPGQELLIP